MTTLATDSNGMAIQAIRQGTIHTPLTTSGSSNTSLAFGSKTNIIRIVCSAACHYLVGAVGTTPVATTNSTYLPADAVEYVYVYPNEKIAVIQAVSGGLFNITEGA